MIGTLTTPTIARMPAARAAVRRSSMAAYSAITPRYRNSRISSEVSRASHTHQVPHMGLPHREPVASARNVNDAPMGALEMATTSASFMRHTRAMAPAAAMTTYTNIDIQAAGTWM